MKSRLNLRSFFVLLPLFALAFGVLPVSAQKGPEGLKTLNFGDAAPAFTLPGIDGKDYTLDDFKDGKVLVVFFTCNHCPSAQAVEARFIQFVTDYKPKGVEIVAISPNSPAGIRPDELGYSLYGDSFEDMKKHAKEQGFNFPYLYDGDSQSVAKAYGCLATPHVFVFDAERKLRYKGRFDDSRFVDPALIKHHDTINAVDALLKGEKVAVKQTRPHGCSTKWAYKADIVTKHAETLDSTPVTIEEIDAEGLKALLAATKESDKPRFRMVNLWATWCVPCVAEMPDLIAISRKFGLRDFEFNTITLDKPGKRERAAAFLSKQGAAPERKLAAALKLEKRATAHYLFTGSNDELAAALDPEWPGPIPYTVLIDTDNKIVKRYSGKVDAEQVTRDIVDQLGKYYVPAKK